MARTKKVVPICKTKKNLNIKVYDESDDRKWELVRVECSGKEECNELLKQVKSCPTNDVIAIDKKQYRSFTYWKLAE